jgi:hypothetical protein
MPVLPKPDLEALEAIKVAQKVLVDASLDPTSDIAMLARVLIRLCQNPWQPTKTHKFGPEIPLESCLVWYGEIFSAYQYHDGTWYHFGERDQPCRFQPAYWMEMPDGPYWRRTSFRIRWRDARVDAKPIYLESSAMRYLSIALLATLAFYGCFNPNPNHDQYFNLDPVWTPQPQPSVSPGYYIFNGASEARWAKKDYYFISYRPRVKGSEPKVCAKWKKQLPGGSAIDMKGCPKGRGSGLVQRAAESRPALFSSRFFLSTSSVLPRK